MIFGLLGRFFFGRPSGSEADAELDIAMPDRSLTIRAQNMQIDIEMPTQDTDIQMEVGAIDIVMPNAIDIVMPNNEIQVQL